MTDQNPLFALRFRMGSLLTGTKLQLPPGWCSIVEMMVEDVARLTGKVSESGEGVAPWHTIERSDEGLKVTFRGPADPAIHAAIHAATALAESTCECCGAMGQRGWAEVVGVHCALCAFEVRLVLDYA